jgi:hypothetical protein
MVEIVVKINTTLNDDEKMNLKLFSHYMQKGLIDLNKVITYMRDFLKSIKNELIFDSLIHLKQTRIWLYHNLIKVLNRKLINPQISEDICDDIIYYQYTLEIYIYLDNCLNIQSTETSYDIKQILWLLRQFFVIDIDIKKKSISKLDSIHYILSAFTKSQTDDYDTDTSYSINTNLLYNFDVI